VGERKAWLGSNRQHYWELAGISVPEQPTNDNDQVRNAFPREESNWGEE